jgi:hypothetical protein
MAEPEDAPELKRRFRGWVYQRFGIKGLVALAVLGLAIACWTPWDNIRAWPGVSDIPRDTVPKSDPQRFSVLVATLSGDPDDAIGNQIFEVLKEFQGIQALPLDRTLAPTGRIDEDEEIAAGERAREYLKQSGASVLIWGSVLDRDKKIARLFLTTSSSAERQVGRQVAPEIGSTVRLPAAPAGTPMRAVAL